MLSKLFPLTEVTLKILRELPVSSTLANSYGSHFWLKLPNGYVIVAYLENSSVGYRIDYALTMPPEYSKQKAWLKETISSGLPSRDCRKLYKAIKKKRKLEIKLNRIANGNSSYSRFCNVINKESK